MPNRNTNFVPIESTLTAKRGLARRNLQLPVDESDYGILLVFRDYQFQAPGTRGRSTLTADSNAGDTIFLPLPENIADSFSIRVQRFDMGLGAIAAQVLSDTTNGGTNFNLGEMQRAALESIQNSLPSAFSSGSNAYSTLTDAFKNLMGENTNSGHLDRFSSDLAFLIRRNLSGDMGRTVDAGTGTYINPKAALSFEGMDLKTHSFSWTVAPKSPTESDNLRDVIRTINRNILPQYVTGEVAQRAMFRYPSMVDIFFVGLDENYFHFFKTAMVQTFNVEYTPNGVSVLKGGRPAAVRLQMSVIESDIHTAEDYGAESIESGT